jgi:hypothetical protein
MSTQSEEAATLADIRRLTPRPVVRISGRAFLCTGPNMYHPYQIRFDRCDSHEKLLAWLRHMTVKGWWTSRHSHQLIQAAEQVGLVKIRHGL